MFLACLPTINAAVFMLRLRDLLFFARMWLPKARSRAILPLPVIFTLFAVPLWVFSFGIIFSLRLSRGFCRPFEAFGL